MCKVNVKKLIRATDENQEQVLKDTLTGGDKGKLK